MLDGEIEAMIIFLLLASLAFVLTVTLLDRPSIPAWQGKYAYRALAFGLWVLLIGTIIKATAWHTELVMMNRLCR